MTELAANLDPDPDYDPLENARLAVEHDPASQPPTERWKLRALSEATPRQTRWLLRA